RHGRREVLRPGTDARHRRSRGAVREAARSGVAALPEGAGGDRGARPHARPAAAHGIADAGVSRLLVIVAACVAAWGCAGRAPLPAAPPPPQFRFANDTFAF